MGTRRPIGMLVLASLCTIFLAGPGPALGRTIYVDDDAAGPQDGSSWAAAFVFLQDALAVAQAGDEIRVAQGTYRPDQGASVTPGDDRAYFHLVNGVAVLGGFAGPAGADPDLQDPARFATILTGDLLGNDDDPNNKDRLADNSYHVVFAKEVGSSTVLDGVTITGGNSGGSGGGMYIHAGGPVVRNCTVLGNYAYGGGGGVFSEKSEAVFVGCTFQGNRCHDGTGGGLSNWGGNILVENCRFVRNRAGEGAGALLNEGGSTQAINCEFIANHGAEGAGTVESSKGSAVFFHCLFRGNDAYDGTAGIASSGDLSLLYCTFANNYGDEHPGALNCSGGTAAIAHCLFYGNAGDEVGGLLVQASAVSLDQCTFYGNVATDGHVGAIYCRGARCPTPKLCIPAGTLTARGCVFWANGFWAEDDNDMPALRTGYTAQISAEPNTATFDYSCIEGWTPQHGGTGNIGADPLFVAPDQNDFHLKSQAGHWDAASLAWVLDDVTSPCIDAGDPNSPVGQEPFPNGGVVNMGAYGGTCEASKSWFGAETGPGIAAADLNGDGRVDAEDLRLALLRQARPATEE